jgi:hypothetical protein
MIWKTVGVVNLLIGNVGASAAVGIICLKAGNGSARILNCKFTDTRREKMKEEGYSAGSMLVSFLFGGVVGAGLALLLAPQSGRETRKEISDFAHVKDSTTDYVEKTKEKITSYDSGG